MAVDYDKMASTLGGVPDVDYDSLASEHGGAEDMSQYDTGQGRLSSFGSQIGRGFSSAILDAVAQAGETASRFSPENIAKQIAYRVSGIDPEKAGAAEKTALEKIGLPTKPIATTAAEYLKGKAEEALPVNPAYQQEFLTTKVPQALGQAAGIILPAVATGGETVAARTAATWLPRIQGALLGMRSGYQEADRQGIEDQAQRDAMAVSFGGIEALTEAMGGIGSKAFTNRFLGEVSRKGGESFIKSFTKIAGTEGLEEPAAGELQDLAANLFGGGTGEAPPEYSLMEPDVLKRRAEEFALGAIASAPLAGYQGYREATAPIEPAAQPPPLPPFAEAGPPIIPTGPPAPEARVPEEAIAPPLQPTRPELAAAMEADLVEQIGQSTIPTIGESITPELPIQVESEQPLEGASIAPIPSQPEVPGVPVSEIQPSEVEAQLADAQDTLDQARQANVTAGTIKFLENRVAQLREKALSMRQPVTLPDGKRAQAPAFVETPEGLEPNEAPAATVAAEQAIKSQPESEAPKAKPQLTEDKPITQQEYAAQTQPIQTSVPEQPKGRTRGRKEKGAGAGNRPQDTAGIQTQAQVADVQVPPQAPSPAAGVPAGPAVQASAEVPAGTGIEQARSGEAAPRVEATLTVDEIVGKLEDSAKVPGITAADLAKEVTRLSGNRIKDVAEALGYRANAMDIAQQLVLEQKKVSAQRRAGEELPAEARPIPAEVSQEGIGERSLTTEEKLERRGRVGREAPEGMRPEDVTEEGDVLFSRNAGERPANINKFHVEQLKRLLSSTKYGRWLLDRLEFFETPVQASAALGITVDQIGNADGIYLPSSKRSAIILSQVRAKGNETPVQAMRRVAVHEAVGHGGMFELIRLFPEVESEMLPVFDEVRRNGWTYTDRAGNEESLLKQYPWYAPNKSDTIEQKFEKEKALFQEWFARSIEGYTPEELAAGKAPSLVQQVWDALVQMVSRFMGRPIGPDTQRFAFDLAKRIFQSRNLMEAPTTAEGGAVITSQGITIPPLPEQAVLDTAPHEWEYEDSDRQAVEQAAWEAFARGRYSFNPDGSVEDLTQAYLNERDYQLSMAEMNAKRKPVSYEVLDVDRAAERAASAAEFIAKEGEPPKPEENILKSVPVDQLTEPPKEKRWWEKLRKGASETFSEYMTPALTVADRIHRQVGNVFRRYSREENIVAEDAQKRTDLAYRALERVNKDKQAADDVWAKIDKRENRDEVIAILRNHGSTEDEINQFTSLFGPDGSFQHFLRERKAAGLTVGEIGTEGQDYFPRKVRADRKDEFRQWLVENELHMDIDPMVNEMMRQKVDDMKAELDKGIMEATLAADKFRKDGDDKSANREEALANRLATKLRHVLANAKNPDVLFTQDERVDMQSQALRRMIVTHGKGGSFKGRRIPELDAKLAGFYERPSEALRNYIAEQTRAIPAARVFGAKAYELFRDSGEEGKFPESTLLDQNSPMGQVVHDLKMSGELTGQQIDKLREIIQALLGHMPPGRALRAIKDANIFFAIGNPISALKQIPSEFGLAASRYGIPTALKVAAKGMFGRWRRAGLLDVERDLHLSPSYEIATRGDALGKMATKLARWSGFRGADLEAANILSNAHIEYLAKLPEAKRMKELEKWKDILDGADKDAALNETSDAIAARDFTHPNVKNVAYYGLLENRPAGLISMPVGYLKAKGIGQIPYNLRGWGLFDLNRHKQNIYDKLRSGDPAQRREAMTHGLYILSVMTLAGAGADEAADWLLGKPVDFNQRVKDNLFKLAMASRYQYNQLTGDRPDLKGTVLSFMNTPALDVASAVWKDAVTAAKDDQKGFFEQLGKDRAAMRLVPLGLGTITQQRFMGAAKEDAAKAIDRELPDNVQRLEKEYSRLRDLKETGRAKSQLTERRWKELSAFSKLKNDYIKRAKEAAQSGDYVEAEALMKELEIRVKQGVRSWMLPLS